MSSYMDFKTQPPVSRLAVASLRALRLRTAGRARPYRPLLRRVRWRFPPAWCASSPAWGTRRHLRSSARGVRTAAGSQSLPRPGWFSCWWRSTGRCGLLTTNARAATRRARSFACPSLEYSRDHEQCRRGCHDEADRQKRTRRDEVANRREVEGGESPGEDCGHLTSHQIVGAAQMKLRKPHYRSQDSGELPPGRIPVGVGHRHDSERTLVPKQQLQCLPDLRRACRPDARLGPHDRQQFRHQSLVDIQQL